MSCLGVCKHFLSLNFTSYMTLNFLVSKFFSFLICKKNNNDIYSVGLEWEMYEALKVRQEMRFCYIMSDTI